MLERITYSVIFTCLVLLAVAHESSQDEEEVPCSDLSLCVQRDQCKDPDLPTTVRPRLKWSMRSVLLTFMR